MGEVLQRECSALVIGSGLAGLNYALTLAEQMPKAKIIVATKAASLTAGATEWAQGGIAAVMNENDSFAEHIQDTLKAGGGLCDEKIVALTVSEGPARVSDLIKKGVPFTRREDNQNEYDFTREGGHSKRRILHVADQTGKAIMDALASAVSKHPQIEILQNCIAVDLLTDHKVNKIRGTKGARCIGAYLLDQNTGKVFSVRAPVTLLATGGAGKVYKYTSNPDTNNGDGIAMAYRLGARIANMEFIQFHPTCLYHPDAKSSLLSEALRGEGAYLRNRLGQRFMEKYHPDKELAPRDVVSLSIDKEMKRTGEECVFLDITHRGEDFIRSHFPHIYATCLRFGFDLAKQPVPVVPAAHYTCGGVLSDAHGESTIQNLFVAGEVAYTGLHGANRLASNSLLEAAVFSYRAALRSVEKIQDSANLPKIPDWNPGFAKEEEEEVIISHNWDEIRTLMWNYVGIVRSNRRLEYAERRLHVLRQEIDQCYWERRLNKNLVELRNLVTVADLIVRAAQMRKESRGLHQNIDYPAADDTLYSLPTLL